MIPEMPEIAERYEKICKKEELLIRELFDSALKEELLDHGRKASKKRNIFNIFKSKNRAPKPLSGSREEIVLSQLREQKYFSDDFTSACISALVMIISGIMGIQGRLVTDQNLITNLSLRLFMNDYGSREVGKIITSRFVKAAKAEGYRFLPAQSNPIVMNTKGASASGKSTIRPKQRILAEKLGVAWEDFALISPDYWRKYLLDYQSMGEDYKYAAMLTGRELEFIDKKLDDYMAQKAADKNVPHLLIDRFRFDSFKTDDQNGQKNTLLSRFGSTIYLFFTITPPQETVERAWKRGLSTSRYKAVDDLLYHNIEAFKGIPQLFFSWMEIKKKTFILNFSIMMYRWVSPQRL